MDEVGVVQKGRGRCNLPSKARGPSEFERITLEKAREILDTR